jgi:hypothetical protein
MNPLNQSVDELLGIRPNRRNTWCLVILMALWVGIFAGAMGMGVALTLSHQHQTEEAR